MSGLDEVIISFALGSERPARKLPWESSDKDETGDNEGKVAPAPEQQQQHQTEDVREKHWNEWRSQTKLPKGSDGPDSLYVDDGGIVSRDFGDKIMAKVALGEISMAQALNNHGHKGKAEPTRPVNEKNIIEDDLIDMLERSFNPTRPSDASSKPSFLREAASYSAQPLQKPSFLESSNLGTSISSPTRFGLKENAGKIVDAGFRELIKPPKLILDKMSASNKIINIGLETPGPTSPTGIYNPPKQQSLNTVDNDRDDKSPAGLMPFKGMSLDEMKLEIKRRKSQNVPEIPREESFATPNRPAFSGLGVGDMEKSISLPRGLEVTSYGNDKCQYTYEKSFDKDKSLYSDRTSPAGYENPYTDNESLYRYDSMYTDERSLDKYKIQYTDGRSLEKYETQYTYGRSFEKYDSQYTDGRSHEKYESQYIDGMSLDKYKSQYTDGMSLDKYESQYTGAISHSTNKDNTDVDEYKPFRPDILTKARLQYQSIESAKSSTDIGKYVPSFKTNDMSDKKKSDAKSKPRADNKCTDIQETITKNNPQSKDKLFIKDGNTGIHFNDLKKALKKKPNPGIIPFLSMPHDLYTTQYKPTSASTLHGAVKLSEPKVLSPGFRQPPRMAKPERVIPTSFSSLAKSSSSTYNTNRYGGASGKKQVKEVTSTTSNDTRKVTPTMVSLMQPDEDLSDCSEYGTDTSKKEKPTDGLNKKIVVKSYKSDEESQLKHSTAIVKAPHVNATQEAKPDNLNTNIISVQSVENKTRIVVVKPRHGEVSISDSTYSETNDNSLRLEDITSNHSDEIINEVVTHIMKDVHYKSSTLKAEPTHSSSIFTPIASTSKVKPVGNGAKPKVSNRVIVVEPESVQRDRRKRRIQRNDEIQVTDVDNEDKVEITTGNSDTESNHVYSEINNDIMAIKEYMEDDDTECEKSEAVTDIQSFDSIDDVAIKRTLINKILTGFRNLRGKKRRKTAYPENDMEDDTYEGDITEKTANTSGLKDKQLDIKKARKGPKRKGLFRRKQSDKVKSKKSKTKVSDNEGNSHKSKTKSSDDVGKSKKHDKKTADKGGKSKKSETKTSDKDGKSMKSKMKTADKEGKPKKSKNKSSDNAVKHKKSKKTSSGDEGNVKKSNKRRLFGGRKKAKKTSTSKEGKEQKAEAGEKENKKKSTWKGIFKGKKKCKKSLSMKTDSDGEDKKVSNKRRIFGHKKGNEKSKKSRIKPSDDEREVNKSKKRRIFGGKKVRKWSSKKPKKSNSDIENEGKRVSSWKNIFRRRNKPKRSLSMKENTNAEKEDTKDEHSNKKPLDDTKEATKSRKKSFFRGKKTIRKSSLKKARKENLENEKECKKASTKKFFFKNRKGSKKSKKNSNAGKEHEEASNKKECAEGTSSQNKTEDKKHKKTRNKRGFFKALQLRRRSFGKNKDTQRDIKPSRKQKDTTDKNRRTNKKELSDNGKVGKRSSSKGGLFSRKKKGDNKSSPVKESLNDDSGQSKNKERKTKSKRRRFKFKFWMIKRRSKSTSTENEPAIFKKEGETSSSPTETLGDEMGVKRKRKQKKKKKNTPDLDLCITEEVETSSQHIEDVKPTYRRQPSPPVKKRIPKRKGKGKCPAIKHGRTENRLCMAESDNDKTSLCEYCPTEPDYCDHVVRTDVCKCCVKELSLPSRDAWQNNKQMEEDNDRWELTNQPKNTTKRPLPYHPLIDILERRISPEQRQLYLTMRTSVREMLSQLPRERIQMSTSQEEIENDAIKLKQTKIKPEIMNTGPCQSDVYYQPIEQKLLPEQGPCLMWTAGGDEHNAAHLNHDKHDKILENQSCSLAGADVSKTQRRDCKFIYTNNRSVHTDNAAPCVFSVPTDDSDVPSELDVKPENKYKRINPKILKRRKQPEPNNVYYRPEQRDFPVRTEGDDEQRITANNYKHHESLHDRSGGLVDPNIESSEPQRRDYKFVYINNRTANIDGAVPWPGVSSRQTDYTDVSSEPGVKTEDKHSKNNPQMCNKRPKPSGVYCQMVDKIEQIIRPEKRNVPMRTARDNIVDLNREDQSGGQIRADIRKTRRKCDTFINTQARAVSKGGAVSSVFSRLSNDSDVSSELDVKTEDKHVRLYPKLNKETPEPSDVYYQLIDIVERRIHPEQRKHLMWTREDIDNGIADVNYDKNYRNVAGQSERVLHAGKSRRRNDKPVRTKPQGTHTGVSGVFSSLKNESNVLSPPDENTNEENIDQTNRSKKKSKGRKFFDFLRGLFCCGRTQKSNQ